MRRLVTASNKDYYGGALMMLIGLAAVIQGRQYPVGTLSRMGPGFFPSRWARSWRSRDWPSSSRARFAAR